LLFFIRMFFFRLTSWPW